MNYSTMSNKELDKLVAEKFMTDYEMGTIETILERDIPALFVKPGVKGLINIGEWNPTNPNSGQIWDVLAAMSDMGFDWKLAHKCKRKDLPDCCFIYIYKEKDLINTVLNVHKDELCRDILICCLLVLDDPTPLITPETYYCEFCFGDIDINDKDIDKSDGETYSHKNCNTSTIEGEN